MDRRSRELALICEAEQIEVSALAQRFDVSQVTIRKDLAELERQGLIRREHGYAVAIAPDNLLSRLAMHFDAKRGIARAAAALVSDHETVMIESGSCCALLAAELATRRGITIITNSAFIADYVRSGAAKVVLLGGDYQPEAQVTVGPLMARCVEAYHVARLFVGVDGYTPGLFCGKDMARAEAVRAMAARAGETVVLSVAAKFERQGAVALLPATDVAVAVTEQTLLPNVAQQLAEAGVNVVLTGVGKD